VVHDGGGHEGGVVWHWPFEQKPLAHDFVPSGHCMQNVGGTHCASEVHCAGGGIGHGGYWIWQTPFTQIGAGQSLEPSGHTLHGAPSAGGGGQSLSVTQLGGGHIGAFTWHLPPRHIALKHIVVPSGHCWQAPGTAQSPSEVQPGGGHWLSIA
jgi:hypothetical protein